jgi:alkaline phosphatase D
MLPLTPAYVFMKIAITFILLLIRTPVFPQTAFKIAFGSCSDQTKDEQLWTDIIKTHPDVWIWSGDNIYGDTTSLDVLKNKYYQQKNRKEYQQLISQCTVTGTWDDHDYGINDGGKYFSAKQQSKILAANFLGFPDQNSVWSHEGLYNSTIIRKGNQFVKIINLDTRYFRDTVYKEHYVDAARNQSMSRYQPNTTGDILGEEQWRWLEEELKNSTAVVNIINSSIQVISEEHPFEKWGNLPASRKRLLELLVKYPDKKVVIISGDRHIAELSKKTVAGLPYPLCDFTSSGLTHTWDEIWEEKNRYRVGELIIQKNFGLIEIVAHRNKVSISFSVMGKDGIVYQKHRVVL